MHTNKAGESETMTHYQPGLRLADERQDAEILVSICVYSWFRIGEPRISLAN